MQTKTLTWMNTTVAVCLATAGIVRYLSAGAAIRHCHTHRDYNILLIILYSYSAIRQEIINE